MNINEKYELYKILDENDFVPSDINLNLLIENIEDVETLDEGLGKAIRKWNNKRHAKKRMKQMWKDGKAAPQLKKAEQEKLKEAEDAAEKIESEVK